MGLKYRVTVDGTAYTVEVDELGAGAAPFVSAPVPAVSAPAPVAAPAAPAPAPAPVAAPAAPAPAAAPSAGSVIIEAPLPGKILDIKVSVGAAVKSGDLLLVLEAMKMENEIFATGGGTVKEIRVKSGDNVNTGDVMVVIG